jgi:hypothetical protein
MANTLNLGNGNWAVKEDSLLAYNSENGNFKPLPFDFTRASSATVVNKDGLIEVVGSGKPRIDFKDDAKGALLLEPSRTNLILYSEAFDNSYWTKLGTSFTVTPNNVISPSGKLNASTINVTNNDNILYRGISGLSSSQSTWNFSIYAKGTGTFNMNIRLNSATLTTETKTLTNEWQRFDVSVIGTPTITSVESYIKLNTSSTYQIWGAQVEESYATSLIPTQGSAVTRVADVCNNAGNNQVFNDSEGVLIMELASLIDNGTLFRNICISDGGSSDKIQFYYRPNENQISMLITSNSSSQGFVTFTLSSATSFNKIAIKYKQNDFALWVNGIEVGIITSGNTPIGLSKMSFDDGTGGSDFYGNVKQIQYFDSALTDAELISLTTI